MTAPNSYGIIDQLTYTYGDAARPDRLTNMVDAGSIAKGFKYTAGAAAYVYDANGNMTQDNHKGFTFGFNFLNLPQSFTQGSNVITMTYTADGEKLTKALTGGGATKNYVGGIEYSGANLEAIYFGEGRCTPNGATAFHYDYTVKDHLGNARVNFRANGTAITSLDSMHYYPFGMLMEGIGTNTPANDYTYNYKELNEDFGLNLYDYGARWYDASVGRWWSVDPMGEGTVSITNYAYVSNSPMILIDPSGMYQLTYGVGGYSTPSEWANAKAEEFSNRNNEYRKQKKESEDKTKVNINVTDEVVGEGYVYADGQLNTDEYFAVNIYKMTVSFTDASGESISQDFEVLKYGVKYNAGTDEYYYQGFGGGSTTSETTIENPSFDGHYTYGGFNLYDGGRYDLHPQHSKIRDVPGDSKGRVNKGCIGVCGKGTSGWGGVTDLLFRAAGMPDQVGATQTDKKRLLSSMLGKIDLKITIAAFSIPTNTPLPIKK